MIYIPPNTKKLCGDIEHFMDLSFKREILNANDIDGDDPPTVRILYLHGANQDITSTRVMVQDTMIEISTYLPPSYHHIECWTVDYPGYSQHGNRDLIGTKELDDQIESLWIQLLTGKKKGINIIWGYSIGTRYAAELYNRRYEVDLLFCQSPFYDFPTSYGGFGGAFYPPPRGSGVNVINMGRKSEIIFYLAELDEIFPPKLSSELLKNKCTTMIIEPGAKHDFFITLKSSQTSGCIIGKFIEKNVRLDNNVQCDASISLLLGTIFN